MSIYDYLPNQYRPQNQGRGILGYVAPRPGVQQYPVGVPQRGYKPLPPIQQQVPQIEPWPLNEQGQWRFHDLPSPAPSPGHPTPPGLSHLYPAGRLQPSYPSSMSDYQGYVENLPSMADWARGRATQLHSEGIAEQQALTKQNLGRRKALVERDRLIKSGLMEPDPNAPQQFFQRVFGR